MNWKRSNPPPGADELPDRFSLKTSIYVVPPFRHTHFEGRQIVVNNRCNGLHEMFSHNLYTGPSTRKGTYGARIALGERAAWVTAHREELFRRCFKKSREPDVVSPGLQITGCCLDGGGIEDYAALIRAEPGSGA